MSRQTPSSSTITSPANRAPARRPRPVAVARPTALALGIGATLVSLSATAFDARSIALGGSTVANGRGVHGAVENPAALGAMKRRGERVHLLLGGAVDARDSAGVYDIANDGSTMDLADDIDDEIDRLSGSTLECDPLLAADEETCLSGVAGLGALSFDGLDVLDDVDGEPSGGYGVARVGIAVTAPFVPFALHVGARGAARGQADIDPDDRRYVELFGESLSDDRLTAGELRSEEYADLYEVNFAAATVTLSAPEDVIESTGDAAAMIRTQFGVSLATSLAVGDLTLDVGVTPKFSSLTAYGLSAEFRDAFDGDEPSLADQLEDTETDESSFTFDIGVATDLAALPIRVAAVLHNVVPESIETDTGFEFETTPQLVVGAYHQRGMAGFTADLAVNSAEIDGIETQPIALGVEFGKPILALRAGLSADLGRDDDRVALSAGFALGPLEVGGRLSGINRGQFGAQLAFSF